MTKDYRSSSQDSNVNVLRDMDLDISNAIGTGSIIEVSRAVEKAYSRLGKDVSEEIDDIIAAEHTFASAVIMNRDPVRMMPFSQGLSTVSTARKMNEEILFAKRTAAALRRRI